MDSIIEKIKRNENIPINELKRIQVDADGNCLYRTFSYYLYEDEDHHKLIRKEIYQKAKLNIEEIKPFL